MFRRLGAQRTSFRPVSGKELVLAPWRSERVEQTGTANLEAKGHAMTKSETGEVTGTSDKDYNVIWFTEACLSNVLRLETYIADAKRVNDSELAEFFQRAQAESRKDAGEKAVARGASALMSRAIAGAAAAARVARRRQP
jgi:hypothetical protein